MLSKLFKPDTLKKSIGKLANTALNNFTPKPISNDVAARLLSTQINKQHFDEQLSEAHINANNRINQAREFSITLKQADAIRSGDQDSEAARREAAKIKALENYNNAEEHRHAELQSAGQDIKDEICHKKVINELKILYPNKTFGHSDQGSDLYKQAEASLINKDIEAEKSKIEAGEANDRKEFSERKQKPITARDVLEHKNTSVAASAILGDKTAKYISNKANTQTNTHYCLPG